jgi:nucleoside-diphosphate-sugar epimerase
LGGSNTRGCHQPEERNVQTILGSGGAIGVELARALTGYTDAIRLVSRRPEKVNPTDELFSADLLNPDELKNAVKGSSIVYVTVGLPYNYKIWKENWPKLMSNVIDACLEYGCKLVFFDNIYMYDPGCLGDITEETPVAPSSKKGAIRAQIHKMIMDKIATGELTGLIARSADFYGPGIESTSILTEMVFKPLSEGKKATWMGSANFKHSFTFTPDAGKATALLGNTEKAYQQVWHLPTAPGPPTGKGWIEAIAEEMGVKPRYRTASKLIVTLLGVFIPVMREMPEMMYQYDRDYVFNSLKFERAFDLKPTPYLDGIKEVVKADYAE